MNLEELKTKVLLKAEALKPLIQEVGQFLWENPELSLEEVRGAHYLSNLLENHGFKVERGVAGYPTAFVGRYQRGEGAVLGFSCEFDALPGLSSRLRGAPGHGCSHNMFAATAITSAILLKECMEEEKIDGGVVLLGTPAEEKYGCKPFFVRQGITQDIDAFLSFHPLPWNGVFFLRHNAAVSKIYRFYGKSAHAAVEPENGKSALAAMEYMNVGINFLSRFVPDDVRMHYVVNHGGVAPGIIPDYAEVSYSIRAAELETLDDIEARVDQFAKSSAEAFDCKHESELCHRLANTILNRTYSKLAHKNLCRVGLPEFDLEDEDRLKKLGFENGFHREIHPLPREEGHIGGSTDEADFSWVAPWARMSFASLGLDTKGHSREEDAQSNYPAAYKAALQTVKASVCTALDLLLVPENMIAVRKEHQERMAGKRYPMERDIFPKEEYFPNAPGWSRSDVGLVYDLNKTVLLRGHLGEKVLIKQQGKIIAQATLDTQGEIPLGVVDDRAMLSIYLEETLGPRIVGYIRP